MHRSPWLTEVFDVSGEKTHLSPETVTKLSFPKFPCISCRPVLRTEFSLPESSNAKMERISQVSKNTEYQSIVCLNHFIFITSFLQRLLAQNKTKQKNTKNTLIAKQSVVDSFNKTITIGNHAVSQ